MIKCCIDCQKRQVGCHAECEEYLAEKKRHDEEKEVESKARLMEYTNTSYDVDRNRRIKKGIHARRKER